MEQSFRLIELFVTPVGIVLLLLIVSFVAYMRSYWAGTVMLASTTVIFVILSLPLTAHTLMGGLQGFAKPLDLEQIEKETRASGKTSRKDPKSAQPPSDSPQAIVVLGAGRYSEAPEYGLKDTVSRFGLVRLRYAAELQRASGLPILVSGGAPGGESVSEAELMRDVLTSEFRVNVKWIEGKSRNTSENARFSAEQLGNTRHVYLVTHAWHMRRATREFERAGIRVTPAPTGFHTLSPSARALIAYLPSSDGLYMTRIAMHERLGFLWYDMNDNNKPSPEISPKPAAVPAPKPAR